MVYIYLTNTIIMKRLLFILFALQSLSFFSQQSPAPFINYQGVARQQDGTPVTGLIGVELIIKQGSLTGTTSLTERYTVPTNTFGIFNLKIGTDKPNDFAAIDWANGPYFLIVKIDTQGGNNYTTASEQQLVSVPYAMYAKEAKNARIYVAGNNVTINNPSIGNTYTINAQGGSSGGVDTISVIPSNHTVNSNGYKHTITVASPTINSNSDIISVSNSFPTYNLSYKTPSLSLSSGSVLTIQQGTYTSTPVILPGNASVPIWTLNAGNIVQVNTSALVGIGLPTPSAKLDITGNTSNIINATTTGSGNVINAATTGGGNGVFVSAAAGAALIGVNSSSTGAAVQANNSGVAESLYAYKTNVQTGTVAKFENLSGTNSLPVVVVNSNGNSSGINVSVASANAITASSTGGTSSMYATNSGAGYAIEGNNTGTGSSIRGSKTTGSGSSGVFDNSVASNNAAVLFVNNSSNVGGTAISVTHTTGVGINVSTNGAGDVIDATTSGGGIGLKVNASGNNAVNIQNNSGTAPAFVGTNNGSAGVIYAAKTGTQTGSVVILENTNSGNANEAVRINNSGSNTALNINTATTSTLGLTLSGGHIKSSGLAPNVITYTLTGGVSSVNFTTTGCTDVKGSVLAVATTTGLINIGGQIGIRVNFNKGYAIPPTVVITPTSDFLGMSYYLSAVNQNFFQVYIKNTTSGNIPGSSIPLNFNYFVIE